jgi:hypothetical protein
MPLLAHPSCVTENISEVCTTRSQLRKLRLVTELTMSKLWYRITEVSRFGTIPMQLNSRQGTPKN